MRIYGKQLKLAMALDAAGNHPGALYVLNKPGKSLAAESRPAQSTLPKTGLLGRKVDFSKIDLKGVIEKYEKQIEMNPSSESPRNSSPSASLRRYQAIGVYSNENSKAARLYPNTKPDGIGANRHGKRYWADLTNKRLIIMTSQNSPSRSMLPFEVNEFKDMVRKELPAADKDALDLFEDLLKKFGY